jgi:hypothetical protein
MLIFVAAAMVAQFVAAIAFMLGVGAVHTWIPAVPTVGYVEAVVIVAMSYVLSLLGTFGVKFTFSRD